MFGRFMTYPGLTVLVLYWCTSLTSGAYDICRTSKLRESHGLIEADFHVQAPNQEYPCVVEIHVASNTYVDIDILSMPFGYCPADDIGRLLLNRCKEDDRFMFIFDSHYKEDTARCFAENNFFYAKKFKSSSSKVFVGLCYNYKYLKDDMHVNFNLSYTAVFKNEYHAERYGTLNSPFFPHLYMMNDEEYTYTIGTETDRGIYLICTDFDVSYTSEIYISNSEVSKIYTGTSARPVLSSSVLPVKIVFDTGYEYKEGLLRVHMGFKMEYHLMASNEALPKEPITACGGYNMFSSGGILDLVKIPSSNPAFTYDCVFVIRTQDSYEKTLLHLVEHSVDAENRDWSSIVIRRGLTSQGDILQVMKPGDVINSWTHSEAEGFYIRVMGHFHRLDKVRFSYASVVKRSPCPSNTWQCATSKNCIPSDLQCDKVEHCADGSDERSGCSWYNQGSKFISGGSSMAVSIIIPIVITIILLFMTFVLFLLFRKYRRAREFARRERDIFDSDSGPTVYAPSDRERARDRRRRSRRDLPPSYDDAMESPPIYQGNYDFVSSPGTKFLPKPPDYDDVAPQSGSPLQSGSGLGSELVTQNLSAGISLPQASTSSTSVTQRSEQQHVGADQQVLLQVSHHGNVGHARYSDERQDRGQSSHQERMDQSPDSTTAARVNEASGTKDRENHEQTSSRNRNPPPPSKQHRKPPQDADSSKNSRELSHPIHHHKGSADPRKGREKHSEDRRSHRSHESRENKEPKEDQSSYAKNERRNPGPTKRGHRDSSDSMKKYHSMPNVGAMQASNDQDGQSGSRKSFAAPTRNENMFCSVNDVCKTRNMELAERPPDTVHKEDKNNREKPISGMKKLSASAMVVSGDQSEKSNDNRLNEWNKGFNRHSYAGGPEKVSMDMCYAFENKAFSGSQPVVFKSDALKSKQYSHHNKAFDKSDISLHTDDSKHLQDPEFMDEHDLDQIEASGILCLEPSNKLNDNMARLDYTFEC